MDSINNSTKYTRNDAEEIVTVGRNWDSFARENDSPPELLSDNILHRSFWDFVSGDALQHDYRRLIARARAGETLEFSFRCDSPSHRQYMKFTMAPIAGSGVEFVTETVSTQQRQFQQVFDATSARTDGVVVACSWCNKLRVGENAGVRPRKPSITSHSFRPTRYLLCSTVCVTIVLLP